MFYDDILGKQVKPSTSTPVRCDDCGDMIPQDDAISMIATRKGYVAEWYVCNRCFLSKQLCVKLSQDNGTALAWFSTFNLRCVTVLHSERINRASYSFDCGCRASGMSGQTIYATFYCGAHV